jgi:glycerophosphoryl diester phosphodiesterase
LQEAIKLDAKIKLALLTSKGTVTENLAALGFTPEIYSPKYELVTEALMKEARKEGMQVIPWTVNDSSDMKKLMDLGVDGIITDYPDICVKIATNYEGKGQRQAVQ